MTAHGEVTPKEAGLGYFFIADNLPEIDWKASNEAGLAHGSFVFAWPMLAYVSEQIEGPDEPEEKKRTDYTGLKIGVAIAPVLLFFIYIDQTELGLAVSIVLGMTLLAIKMRWELRRHVWFWVTIAIVPAANFLLLARVPQKWFAALGPLHAVGLLPIAVADLLITLGAIGIARKLFLRDSSPEAEGE